MKKSLVFVAFLFAFAAFAHADTVIDYNFFSNTLTDFNQLTSSPLAWIQVYSPFPTPTQILGDNNGADSNLTQLEYWHEGTDANFSKDMNISFDVHLFDDVTTGNRGAFRFILSKQKGGVCATSAQQELYVDSNGDTYFFFDSYFNPTIGNIPKQDFHVLMTWDVNELSGDGNGYFHWIISDDSGNELFDFNSATKIISSNGLATLFYSDWWVWCNQRDNLHYLISNINIVSYHETIPTLQAEVTKAFDPFVVGVQPAQIDISLSSNLTGAAITGASCTGYFSDAPITYSEAGSGIYSYSTYPATVQVYDFNYSCSKAGYFDANGSGTIEGIFDFRDYLVVEDISNSAHTIDLNSVNIFPTKDTNETVFSILNNSTYSVTVPIVAWNNSKNGNQYFIYTSTDGNTWTFNDSLTYGTSPYDPIQKIWVDANSSYKYEQTDSFTADEKTYYSIRYQPPVKYWNEIKNSSEWFNQLEPTESDWLGRTHDVFSISTFSDARSYMIENLPSLVNNDSNVFSFQFTAWADSPISLSIGTRDNNVDNFQETIIVSTKVQRFNVNVYAASYDSQLIFQTDANVSQDLHILDYALIEKNYFTGRLRIFQSDGTELPVTIVSGQSQNYLQEGLSFLVKTKAFDRLGDLNYLKVTAFLDSNTTAAKSYFFTLDSSALQSFDFSEMLEPVIDLNGTFFSPTTPRTLFVQAQLINDSGEIVSEQSQSVKFLQFPNFSNDFSLNAIMLPTQTGGFPVFDISIRNKSVSSLLGLKFNIWREGTQSRTNPDYTETIYNGSDFTCNAQCSFRLTLNQYVFPTSGTYRIEVLALLNTENENYQNPFTLVFRHYIVSFKTFETARILEIIERNQGAPSEYKNTEPIGLVLQLRTGTGENLNNELRVKMRISDCNAATGATGCNLQETEFYPNSFSFDPTTKYNYFFFRDYLINDDGSLLYDGNYYRFTAIVQDAKGEYSGDVNVLLTGKCNTYSSDFFANALNSLGYLLSDGCNVDQNSIVTTTDNNAQEKRILVNNAVSLSAPTIEAAFCLNTDRNNLYVDAFQQELLCGAWYKISNMNVDKIKFTIANHYSDFSETGNDAQYLQVEVPFEIIQLNDMPLLKSELETKFDTQINTVGDAMYYGFNELFTGIVNPLGEITGLKANDYDSPGLIDNVGFDVNFQRPFDPTYVSGLVFFKVKGVSVVNQNDYVASYPELSGQSPTLFRQWAKQKGISVPNGSVQVVVYGSDLQPLQTYFVPTGLIINEEPSQKRQIQNSDLNSSTIQSLPSKLLFNVIIDLYADNFSYLQTRYVPITITAIINEKQLSTIEGFGKSFALLTSDPVAWAVKNILIIVIVLCVLVIVAVIAAKFGTLLPWNRGK